LTNVYITKNNVYQFGYNLRTTSLSNGYIAEYSDLNNLKVIKLTVNNNRVSDLVYYNNKTEKTWVDCMKKGIKECYDPENDLVCTIVCALAAKECIIGFALGCLF